MDDFGGLIIKGGSKMRLMRSVPINDKFVDVWLGFALVAAI